MGEVHAELLHDPCREEQPAVDFYRMQIAAKGIPLTDELQIHISSQDGEQLACVKGTSEGQAAVGFWPDATAASSASSVISEMMPSEITQ